MSAPSLEVSAPGSIMITGEHAVVYGHPAIACAIEQRISIRFAPRQDRQILVHSDICDSQTMSLDDISAEGPLRYIFGSVALHKPHLAHGFTITINSQINPTLGLGSSAAVTIAMLGGLMAWEKLKQNAGLDSNEAISASLDYKKLHRQALRLVRDMQGRGSGADLAASLHGGMISYQLPEDLLSDQALTQQEAYADIHALAAPPEMSLCYCGYKTPTAVVLAKIAEDMKGKEQAYANLYARMGAVATKTIKAASSQDWQAFDNQINTYQDLMVELGVSDPTLDDLISRARTCPGVTSAKISGSGLGDCILAFGPKPDHHQSARLANQGLSIKRL